MEENGIITKVDRDTKYYLITEEIKEIGDHAFCCCKLVSIDIPEGVENVREFAFAGCKELEFVRIPSTLRTLERSMFSDCESLKWVEIAEGIKVVEKSAFLRCSSLEEIRLPESVEAIQTGAFLHCKLLRSIYLPDGIKNIENSVFEDCKSLKDVRLPANLEYLGNHAFFESGLETLTMYENIKDIQLNAFAGCRNLKRIDITGEKGTITLHERLQLFHLERADAFLEAVRNPGMLDSFFSNDDYMGKEKYPLALYHIDNHVAKKFIKKNLDQITGYLLINGGTGGFDTLADNGFITTEKADELKEQAKLLTGK